MHSRKNHGFTLVELIVSISIFILMTSLLIANYGAFNNSVLLTDLAYDIALAIRTAQTYGISVQGQCSSGGGNCASSNFQAPYGVAFCAISACSDSSQATFTNQQVVLFADTSPFKGSYGNSDQIVSPSYTIKRGAKIVDICTLGNGWQCGNARTDITFLRPNPNALICVSDTAGPNDCVDWGGTVQEVEIVVQAPDGSERAVIVRNTGQISVENHRL